MTYSEKKAWLSRYQISLKREKVLADEIEVLRSRACRVTPALTGMPGGPSDGQSLPRAVEAIIQAQQELDAQSNQCSVVRRKVIAALNQVANPRDHEILRRRYILGQRWEEIAVEMHLEYRWVTRSHHKAVDKMILTPESPI